jgi:cell division protein FtsA
LDCRIGYPNEHLAKNEVLPKNVYEELQSPMYATGIGLLIKGVQKIEYDDTPMQETTDVKKKTKEKQPVKKPNWIELLKTYIKDDIPDKDFIK